jgi:lipoprotein-releasing system ATP-binding protein
MVNPDTARSSLISVQKMSKSFKTSGEPIEILDEVDLEINLKETIAVVGDSGIGKSTFMHLLGTLDRPDSGSLTFNQKDVLQFDDEKLAKFRNEFIGFMFQFHHLLPEFSALENTMMPALINGKTNQQASEAAEEILTRVGLKKRLHHRVGELSGGEQQRVALARSIVLKPALLLADEPTGNLDKNNSQHVHELFVELNKEFSMTMVIVTHNTELSALMSRSITIVDRKLVEI